MFLKDLQIIKGSEVLRSISFHKGINLIIDETKTSDLKESGNNVGKTTVLRLIDFCLGSDGKNIYRDTEFRNKANTEIENFLNSNNITIELTLTNHLEKSEGANIVIRRNFLSRKDKIQEINGKSFNDYDFQCELKKLIFLSTSEKPTFRQIIAKNIRDEKNRLNNTLKVLHSTTRLDEYESLYLFWLGVDLENEGRKQQLIRESDIEKGIQRRLKKERSLSQIEQSLLVIEKEIEDNLEKKNHFSINKNFVKEIDQLNQVKFHLNELSSELTRNTLRKSIIEDASKQLTDELENVDTTQIKELYSIAKSYIPEIQKSFEQTLEFHNKMVAEKSKFMIEELPALDQGIERIKKEIALYLKAESELSEQLHKVGALQGLEPILNKLNSLYQQKGDLEGFKRLLEDSIAKLNSIEEELEEIAQQVNSQNELIQLRVSEFNKFFADLTDRLYGEKFVLSADQSIHGYELNISSLSGNLGTGKKKGQIAAFDLAYIEFADKLDIPCLHFILHDQIENVHDNQINILTDIVKDMNCQMVLPVLKDKLPPNVDLDSLRVLTLSQDNKLFRI